MQRSSGLALKFQKEGSQPTLKAIPPQNQALCNRPGCLDPLQRSAKGSDGQSVHPSSLLRLWLQKLLGPSPRKKLGDTP